MRLPAIRQSTAWIHCVFSVISILTPAIAVAALGGTVDSIEADRASLSATKKVSAHGSYTVNTLQADWIVMREYVSASGQVFGVAWQGSAHPDLQKILGAYWDEYHIAVAASSRKHGQRTSIVHTPKIAVWLGGHMRSLHGVAYVASLLPSGVSPEEIK